MGLNVSGRGQRHIVKAKRCEVVSCPEFGYRGSWMPYTEAMRLISDGYYPPGTVLRIVHENRKVKVVKVEGGFSLIDVLDD